MFIGATLTHALLKSMVAAMLVFFIAESALYPMIGNHGLWLAFILYLATRGLSQWYLFRRRYPRPV